MNIQKMLKQAQKMQAQMQADMARTQEELAAKTVEASVGGGKVTVVASGSGEILSIKISKDVVDPEDVELLEDLVLGGVKQAIGQAHDLAQSEMSKVTSGLDLPPGLGF
jgi:DNA-binding YbaB/EbfC family protein